MWAVGKQLLVGKYWLSLSTERWQLQDKTGGPYLKIPCEISSIRNDGSLAL